MNIPIQSLQDFYQSHQQQGVHLTDSFYVFQRDEFSCNQSLRNEWRAFFKISLVVKGSGRLSYGDQEIEINRSSLTCLNPYIPYSWKPYTDEQTGYFCIFTTDFLSNLDHSSGALNSPFLQLRNNPIRIPDQEQIELISFFFKQMLQETQGNFPHRYSTISNYLSLILLEALKIKFDPYLFKNTAAFTLCSRFMELLDQQFSNFTIGFRPIDFSNQLNVHVNSLNRAVKKIAGRTTTHLIAERTLQAAKHLLLQPDNSIAEIAYHLGFEHPSNFNIFFKKHTSLSPTEFRLQMDCYA
jgi:AraC family transcriptional regulator, transcriptional activator of pobA